MEIQTWDSNRCRKKLFLSICQIAKVPNKLATSLYNQEDEAGNEYKKLVACLKENERDLGYLQQLEFVVCEHVAGLVKNISALIETYGTKAEKKGIEKLYSIYVNAVGDSYDSCSTYCLVDHRSPHLCAIFGEAKEVSTYTELDGPRNASHICVRPFDVEEDLQRMIVIVPTRSLFFSMEDLEQYD